MISVEGSLISKSGVPHQALHWRQDFVINKLFRAFVLLSLFKDALLEVHILQEEFLNLLCACDDDSGLKPDDGPYGWPSVFLFDISEFQHIRGTVQKCVITDNFES